MASSEDRSYRKPSGVLEKAVSSAVVAFCPRTMSSRPRSRSSVHRMRRTGAGSFCSACRLHRPAACTTLSIPAEKRITRWKEMSTPASITCVETQTTLCLSAEGLSSADCKACRVSLRCWTHMAADRWKHRQFAACSDSNRNVASFFVLHTTSRLSHDDSAPMTICGSSSSLAHPAFWISVRLKMSHSAFCCGTRSTGWRRSGWSTTSRQGWVAEHRTIVTPQISDRKLTAKLNSVSILPGTVCTSSITMTLPHSA